MQRIEGQPKEAEREHFATSRIVVKIGSQTITEGATSENPLNTELIDSIARQCSHLHNNGVGVVIVSSGAVACGRHLLSIEERSTQDRQVEALYGQPTLISTWVAAFRKYGVTAGQALITEHDLAEAKKVLQKSLQFGVVIVNINDAVSREEIDELLDLADNDRTAEEVADAVKADTVLMLTDVDGVLDANNKLIEDGFQVKDGSDFFEGSEKGTGGMRTKVERLRSLANRGVKGVIARATREDIVLEVARGNTEGISTTFEAK